MIYTVPQLRLLKEGELYGNYTKQGEMPIDQLINFVQAYFIDWDLSNPKFISWFEKTHPHATAEYLSEMGGMKQVLLDELPTANQSENLINALLKRTEASEEKTGRSILNVDILRNDALDLSVRAGHVLREEGIDTLKKLIMTPKSEMLKWRHLGRVTLRELENKVAGFVDNQGSGNKSKTFGWDRITPSELKQVVAWVNSTYTTSSGIKGGRWVPQIIQ